MDIKMKECCLSCQGNSFELINKGLSNVILKCKTCGRESGRNTPFEFVNHKGNNCTFGGCILLEENGSYKKEEIKEEKMEKIVVRSWKDFDNYRVVEGKSGAVVSVSFKQIFLETNKTRIGEAVKMFNAIGGNFEYKPVEVIDTFPKFRKFLNGVKIAYRPSEINEFYSIILNEFFNKETLEKMFDVDLKILEYKGE